MDVISTPEGALLGLAATAARAVGLVTVASGRCAVRVAVRVATVGASRFRQRRTAAGVGVPSSFHAPLRVRPPGVGPRAAVPR
jgi:hypothetical protein